jgi:uncharacterized protein (TIGR03118 family)
MTLRLPSSGRLPKSLIAASALVAAGSLTWIGMGGAQAAPATVTPGGTVLQTNLVSDLPGVAADTDQNLVNPWGISESTGSPFWISDNNAGVSTLYSVPGAGNTPVSTLGLVVNIPTPVSLTGGAPTGTTFNFANAAGAFKITGVNKNGVATTAPALFLFDTEDGTIVGWNPNVNPPGTPASQAGAQGTIAVDNSGNNFTNPDPNQQTGAVYKGLAMATSSTPIVAGDSASTALLYAANFRDGTVDVYDSAFTKVTTLPAGAFTDPRLPDGYAPFDVQVLNGKVYVSYAKQNATKHDDDAGPGRGFVDVYNLDGTPGLPGGKVRLISRGPLNSPWGLATAPAGFAGLSAPGGDPVLLVGNFGNGRIHAFDATNGDELGVLRDPDGEPIVIDGLWALKVGNGGAGGATNTVYFTAGLFGETHGLFGSLSTVTPGSPEGPAEGQWVQANLDEVQLALTQLNNDVASGAPVATIDADRQALNADTRQFAEVERDYGADAVADAG